MRTGTVIFLLFVVFMVCKICPVTVVEPHRPLGGRPGYRTADGSYDAKPKNTYFPDSLENLQDIIKELATSNRKVRVSGGNHTFNDISVTNDAIIRMTKLTKLLNVDKKRKRITVEAGATLMTINSALKKNDMALSVLPAIPFQSIGGAVSTATHGSRLGYGTFSSMLTDMTVVLADGSVKKIDDTDPEFAAFRTSLGALGAIYSVTLQCEPQFAIFHQRVKLPLKTINHLLTYLHKHYQFLQFYVWPFSTNLMSTVYLRRRIDPPKNRRFHKKWLESTAKLDSVKKGTRFSSSDVILTKNQEGAIYTEIEIAIPVQNLVPAVKDIVRIYKKYRRTHGYYTKYSILARFVKADKDSLLSMAADRTSVFLDIYNQADKWNDPVLNMVFKEFEDTMIRKYKGRPHYGKKNYLNYDKMVRIYGKERINKFNRVRRKYDSGGMFSNNYVKRLLDKT